MLTEKTFDHNGLALNYAEGPANATPLLLLHGATGRWQTFLPILPSFLPRYHTYALDLRGHGQSARAPGAYSLNYHAQDIIAFLRQEVGAPAYLLGHSLGALVALLVAAEAPDLVRGILLEDPPLFELITDPGEVGPRAYQSFRAMHDIMTMDDTTGDKFAALAARLPTDDAARLRHRITQLEQCDPEVVTTISEGKMGGGYLLETLLPKVKCPVLLLQADPALGGLEDHLAERAKSLLADCTHVFLRDAGHTIHHAEPILYPRLIIDFLESF